MPSNKLRRGGCRVVSLAAAVAIATASSAPGVSAKSVSHKRALEAVAIAALAKTPKPVMPAAGRLLGGFTSQSQPVVLAVAKKDKRLEIAATDLNMKCTSGDQLLLPDAWVKLALTPKGAVTMSKPVPPEAAATAGDPTLTGGTDSFSGKLNARKATFSGTWELQLTLSFPDGTTDQCDSGKVSFRAAL
jgi:hypothetical protein